LFWDFKLTKAAKTIIPEESGASFRKRIAKLEAEKSIQQRSVDNGIEDYNLLMAGNASLLDEPNDFHCHCEDL
jgi:hypothetical protein